MYTCIDVKIWVSKWVSLCMLYAICVNVYIHPSFDSLPIETKHKEQTNLIILLCHFYCDISYC